jgi:hypothetical protein
MTPLVLLGGATLLGLAAYAFTRKPTASGSQSAPTTSSVSNFSPPAHLVYAKRGTTPGPTAPSEPFHLRQQSWYRGRIDLAKGTGSTGPGASDTQIATALGNLGFSSVRVFSPSALPANWDKGTETGASAYTRFFQGAWSVPTADVAHPAGVEAIWQIRSDIAEAA